MIALSWTVEIANVLKLLTEVNIKYSHKHFLDFLESRAQNSFF